MYRERWNTSEMMKGVFALLSGNTISQAIGLLICPLLTRLFSPDEFGVFNLFLSIGGVLVLFANAEFHNSIMLPRSEYKAVACLHLGAITTVGSCLLFFFGVSVIFCLGVDVGPIGYWLYAVPVYSFFLAIWNMLNNWYARKKHFWQMSFFQVSQSVGNAVLKSVFGWTKLRFNGLILGTIIGLLVALLLSVATSCRVLRPLLRFDWLACRVMAKKYVNFPKYSLPRSLVNFLSGNLPILLLSPYFSMDRIGLFGMALMLAFRPINMVSTSLYQIFYQRSAEKYRNREPLMPFFRLFTRNTLLLLVPTFFVLFLILPWLVSFLFGVKWMETGFYIRMMLPWLLVSSLVAPICYFADMFSLQKVGLFFELANMLMRVLSLVYGIWMDNFHHAILLYCVSNFVVISVQYFWYLSLVRRYDRSLV